jgi:hypothetical protein
VSEELERVVLQVLEKVPADRYATGAEFASALAAPSLSVPRPRWRRLPKWKAAAALAAVGLGAYVAVTVMPRFWAGLGAAGLDSTRYAILPFERDSGLPSFNEDQLLQDAMSHWSGISIVDRPRMLEALPRSRVRLTSSDAEAIARRVGAGRYVVSQVSMVGDSLRIHSAVYRPSARSPPIHESTAKVGSNRTQTNPAFSQIAERLLFGSSGPGASLDQPAGTTSRPARQAFELGLDSIHSWNLTAADSAFNNAVRYDPQFAEALLWLAQTRSWNDGSVATWQSAAERASTLRERLSVRDRLLSDAVLAQGRALPERACRIWRRATTLDPGDFVPWYGLATCLTGDRAVVRDAASPSHWRFRTSLHEATQAYVRAFNLLPSIHRSFSGSSYLPVRRLLWTNGNALRWGLAVAPDSGMFGAYASWKDSLTFEPHPIDHLVVPATTDLAIRHGRELFHQIASAWVTEYPQSADALEALAISLELLGTPSALDVIRRARAAATTPGQRIRTGSAEVWMRIQSGIREDSRNLVLAREIADSLLNAFDYGAPEPLLLAGLAVVTGRIARAAMYSRDPGAVEARGVPPALAATALPLTVFSAVGGPADSIRTLEQQVASIIDNSISVSLRERARAEWLVRPAILAFPDYQFRTFAELRGSDELLDAQVGFTRSDMTLARRLFPKRQIERQDIQPVNRSLDVLFPEARLLSLMGDDSGAIAWLDPTLAALPGTAPEVFEDLARAAAFVRTMALRAELASRRGDNANAARWAGKVAALWLNADPFLQPVVHRMQRLAP